MPATSDRFEVLTGQYIRTCRTCSIELPLTPENFYHRVERSGDVSWVDRRCLPCCRRRDAETRRLRRAGTPVRGSAILARKFGVEIECIVDRDHLARELVARGLRVYTARYSHATMASWKIVTDASVYNGFELVSPPLSGSNGIDQLRKACEALQAAGASINRSCGLHVHHEVRDLDARQFGRLFRNWSNSQHATDGLVAASRRSSQWCRPLQDDEVAHAENLRSTDTEVVRNHFRYADRYRSLNVAAFPRYGTVEVRQHQGSINFKKIAAWIAFGQAMIANAKSDADISRAADTDALLDRLANHGLTAAQVTYLKARAAHFSGRRAPSDPHNVAV